MSAMALPRSATLLRLLALAGLAGLAAMLSNRLAGPSRRLAWRGSVVAPVPTILVPPARELAVPELAPLAGRENPGVKAKGEHLRTPAPPLLQAPPTSPATSEATLPIREVSSLEAFAAYQSGWPFLDARRSAEFAEGHVRGAFCVPVWEADLDDRLIDFKAAHHPGPGDPIVIYCSGGDCHDSHLLAEKLLAHGYYHLLIYRDGYPDWVAQGRPTTKGALP